MGGTIATGGGDGMVKLWDVARATDVRAMKLFGCKTISAISYNGTGNLIATAGNDNQISLVKSSGMGLVLQGKNLQGHTDLVSGLTFIGSRNLLSASVDRTVRIWDTVSTDSIKVLGCTSAAYCLSVSDSESVFTTGHKTGDIRLWSLG